MRAADDETAAVADRLHAGDHGPERTAVHELHRRHIQYDLVMTFIDMPRYRRLEGRRHAGIEAPCQEPNDQNTVKIACLDHIALGHRRRFHGPFPYFFSMTRRDTSSSKRSLPRHARR